MAYLVAVARKLSFERVYSNSTLGFGVLGLRDRFQ